MSALTIANMLTRPVTTATPDRSVRDILNTMRTQQISALAITKEDGPLGIFTERDAVCFAYTHRDATIITAAEVINQPLFTVPLDMDYCDAYQLLKKSNNHHLIVVDSAGQLVGIVSASDYLDHFGLEAIVHFKQVAAVMTHNVLLLPVDATIDNAVQLMVRQHVSYVLIEDNSLPVGMLTESNLVCLTCDNIDLSSTRLGDIVSNPLHFVSTNITLDTAIVLMKTSNIQHLVVQANGNIVGLLSREHIVDVLYSYHIEHMEQPLFKKIHCPLRELDIDYDTIEQWQSKRALYPREFRYCSLFDNISDGVALYQAVGDGEDFIFTDHNHAGATISGIHRDEVIGKSIREVFPGVEEMGLFEVFQRVWRTGKPEHCPATLYRDERLTLWVENHVFKLPSGRIVAVYEDITQRKLTEDALRESENLFRTLAGLSPVGIFRTDPEGHCTYANQQSAEIVGIGVEACLLSQDWTKNLHTEDKARVRKGWLRAVKTQQTFREEFRFHHANGREIWVICQATPEVSGDGSITGYIGTITDITTLKITQAELEWERNGLERRIQERTAELQAANRELESFTYSVSHDLRAPLRAIIGFSQTLVDNFGKLMEGEARLYLDQVVEGGTYMRDLIDGLLKLSRSTCKELNRERLDLSAMVRSILQDLRARYPERTINIDIQPGMELIGDPRLMKVVMVNLLDNAVKYTSKSKHPKIRVYTTTNGDKPLYCIEDNGAGFDMAYADKLFAPFERLHRQREFPGIGIGLATVQRIIHRHGGQVQVNGALGAGAKICFTVGITKKNESLMDEATNDLSCPKQLSG